MGFFSRTRARVGERMRYAHEVANRIDPGHPLNEAKPAASLKAPPQAQVRRRGYEYGVQLGGSLSSGVQSAYSQERIQILTQLYQAYLTCPWLSGPIDLIARTATAGGLQIVVEDISDHDGVIPEDPPEVIRLRRLMKFCNPREDMVQLLRQTAIDLLLFGDAYLEIVKLLGEPVALYTLDATTVTVLCDDHGEVEGYRQDVDGIRNTEFEPDDVIHISLDAPRGGIYGVSPAQKALLPVTAWLFTEATIKECFRRGDPPTIHVDLGTMKDLDVQRWREMYTVNNLGPKAVGAPVITTGGGIVNPINPRKVADYLETARQLRDEIISAFGVPPSKIGIIEAGNIGGAGTAEGQERTFRINTVQPLQQLILEKLNYLLVQVGFGIQGWHLEFGQIDMRDSEVVERIRDLRLRNGSYTLNRYRDEINEPPVDGGNDPVLIDRQNIVLWSNMDALSQAGIAYKLKGTALEPDDPTNGKPLGISKPDRDQLLQQPLQPPDMGKVPPAPKADLGVGSDPRLPAKDRAGGPDDATPGKPPRESVDNTAILQDGPDCHHHLLPDYALRDIGVDDGLTREMIDPTTVSVDHYYQRPLNIRRVVHLMNDPPAVATHVGLLAVRPDGTRWVISGQHHNQAAVQLGIGEIPYQVFASTGKDMEKRVYRAYGQWHKKHHKASNGNG